MGPGTEPDKVGDLSAYRLHTFVNNEEIGTGTGSEVLGDPYESLAWLCNHLNRRELTLPAGSVVPAGAATGLPPPKPGQVLMTDGATLGSASLSLVA